MSERQWNIYLAGEIHSDWRDRIVAGAKEKNLPVSFSGPVTDHDASDLCGVKILGEEPQASAGDGMGRVTGQSNRCDTGL